MTEAETRLNDKELSISTRKAWMMISLASMIVFLLLPFLMVLIFSRLWAPGLIFLAVLSWAVSWSLFMSFVEAYMEN